MNIKVDFDNIIVKEDTNDTTVKILMLKGEKGDKGDGENNVIEEVQVNGTALPVSNKAVNVIVPTVDSAINSTSENPVQNKAIYTALSNKVNNSDLDNYYEKSDVDNLLNDKADTSDLDSYYTKNSVDDLLNQKINTSDIIDNLTSTNNTKVLSAKQGKVLKDLVDINNNNISTNTSNIATNTLNIANESTERVNADNLLQSQITSLASGSPLVASSTSEMTDTTRTYVNTTDGNWYYYNGSSWVVGGIYQASVVDTTLTQSGIGADANATGQELLKINKNLKFNNNWVKGTMIQGEVYQASAYSPNSRASLNQIIIADENLIVKLSNYNLYKFGIHYFDNNNTFTSETGWQTTDYIIEKGKRFKIVVGLVTIDETSNHFSELVNSISIIPVSKYCEDDIKESLKAKYFNPTLEIGGIYQGNNSTVSNNERLRTPNQIWLNEGDIVAMLNPSVWFACIGYNELKKYNSYDSGWQTNQKFTIPKTGYYRFSFKVQDNSSFGTSNDIYKYERFFIIYNSKGLKQKTFKKATENMHVVLHRGFSPLYPENTLIAFREGKNRGFEEIETDIWFTSDNVPVLCHDPSINRTSNGTGNIADLTLSQLKTYDFGSWKGVEFTGVKIPTLEEAILDAKQHGYRLQLEPKESWTQEQAEIIVGIIQKYNMSKHVSFGGYDGYDLIKIHALDDSIDLKRTCTELNQNNINSIFSNDLKGDNNNTTLIIEYSNVTNEGLELAKTSKCPVHVYFANSIDRYEELCGKYIKEVTTDFINPIEFYNGTIIL